MFHENRIWPPGCMHQVLRSESAFAHPLPGILFLRFLHRWLQVLADSVNRLNVYLENQRRKSSKNEKIFWNEFDFRYFPPKYSSSSYRGEGSRTSLTFFARTLSLDWLFIFLVAWGGGGGGGGWEGGRPH